MSFIRRSGGAGLGFADAALRRPDPGADMLGRRHCAVRASDLGVEQSSSQRSGSCGSNSTTSRAMKIASSLRSRRMNVRTARIRPALRERGVDGVEYGAEPVAELIAPGNHERDARLPNFFLRASESLPHRGRGGRGMPAAIFFASSPSTVCNIRGARTPASIAGCAHADISARR